jgi:hypothetical protein
VDRKRGSVAAGDWAAVGGGLRKSRVWGDLGGWCGDVTKPPLRTSGARLGILGCSSQFNTKVRGARGGGTNQRVVTGALDGGI